MEMLNGGSLHELLGNLRTKGSRLSDLQASQIVKEILDAVAYLHSFNIAHRDLKPGTNGGQTE